MYSPRNASKANSDWRNSALRAAPAAEASRSNTLRVRSLSQRATSTVATASSPVVTSRGRPTVMRRAAQASRGRPIRVSRIGAPISTPSVSPTHQVHQVNARAPTGTTPAQDSASVDRLALRPHATAPASRQKVATSRGSASSSAPFKRQRTRATPKAACSMAPTAVTKDSKWTSGVCKPLGAATSTCTRYEPNNTPGSAMRP